MKTLKLLFILFLFALVTWNNAEAQSVSRKLYDVQIAVWDNHSPELGMLTGKTTLHILNEEYDLWGNPIGEKFNCHMTTLTSSLTGEEFLANFVTHTTRTSDPDVFILTVKTVLIGNMGTRIVCTEEFVYNISTGDFEDIRHNHKLW